MGFVRSREVELDMSDTVIRLKGITKVFLTDEVETHALADIDLEIEKGE